MINTYPFPNFKNPPLHEVALSCQFVPLELITGAHVGLFWSQVKDKYPKVQQHHQLDYQLESFDITALQGGPQIKFMEVPPTVRFWFVTDDGHEILQIQDSKLIHNWRAEGSGKPYPRYSALREQFSRELTDFGSFIEQQSLGSMTPNQVEVTYINHIPVENEAEAKRFLKIWPSVDFCPWLANPETARLWLRHLIPNELQEPIGRLYTDANVGIRQLDGQKVIVLTFVAKLLVNSGTEVLSRIDLGREWIVKSFQSMTTEEAHSLWGKEDE